MKSLLRLIAVALLTQALIGAGVARAAEVTRKPGPAAGKYTADYNEMNRASWKTSFPNLGNYEVLAPSTGRDPKKQTVYNCISHTLRIYHRWEWPGKNVTDFDRLYGQAGYKRVRKLDYSFDPAVEKIVLYAKVKADGTVECTHGAKQLADGTWTSKLGGGPLIRHATPVSVAGPSYGRPIAVYVRVRKVPVIGPGQAKPTAPAVASKKP
jgi:hypothetical protein